MDNKKKYLLLFVTVIAMVAVTLGYFLYNKPAMDVENTMGQKVEATALYEKFTEDSTVAKKKYSNQILEVSGMVTLVSKNQQLQPVVMLKTNTEGAAVNCTLEGPAGDIKAGHTVGIRGICNGMGEGDAELGIMGDVYLVRCYLIK